MFFICIARSGITGLYGNYFYCIGQKIHSGFSIRSSGKDSYLRMYPGGLVLRFWAFTCQSPGSIPGWESEILRAKIKTQCIFSYLRSLNITNYLCVVAQLCPTLCDPRGDQYLVKTALSEGLAPKKTSDKCWQVCAEKETFIHGWWECKRV